MNAPHSPSLLAQVPMAPSDPILGITEAYAADPNPKKVNLGVGVYYDDAGKVPLRECVRRAENHRQLFEAAGCTVRSYPYYDPRTKGLDFPGMRSALEKLPAGAIVVLHACCHNPTGVDLSPENWSDILAIVQRRALIPFLDLAYQGFGDGLDSDALAARLFGGAMSPVFLSTSFSKSLSLYGERIGAFSLVTASPEEAARVLSQLKRIVRTNYSNPPTHGSQLAAGVLASPELRAQWDQELGAMRERIKHMRRELVSRIKQRAPGVELGFILP